MRYIEHNKIITTTALRTTVVMAVITTAAFRDYSSADPPAEKPNCELPPCHRRYISCATGKSQSVLPWICHLSFHFLVSGIWTSVRPRKAGHTRERLTDFPSKAGVRLLGAQRLTALIKPTALMPLMPQHVANGVAPASTQTGAAVEAAPSITWGFAVGSAGLRKGPESSASTGASSTSARTAARATASTGARRTAGARTPAATRATASTGAGRTGARTAERSYCQHGRQQHQCKGC
jgi:hypothetical protein